MVVKRLLAAATAAILSFPASAMTEEDIQQAISSRYGPFDRGMTPVVVVEQASPYTGSRNANEPGLPEGFRAIVWDKPSDRFAALVEDDGTLKRVSGKAWLAIEIPVPNRRIAAGELVSRDDVEMKSVRAEALAGSVITSAQSVIGKEATRLLSPGQPIREDSLGKPAVVRKNEEVLLLFRKGGLQLTSKGLALGDAAQGQPVRVARPSASRPIEGVAVAEGVVMVQNSGAQN